MASKQTPWSATSCFYGQLTCFTEAGRRPRRHYRVGATYNPRKFVSTSSVTPASGNYLIDGSANQAISRKDSETDLGIDVTVSLDWTPPDRTDANQDLNVGVRFNEPVPIHRHNTAGIAKVRSGLSPLLLPSDRRRGRNQGFHSLWWLLVGSCQVNLA